MVTPFELRPHRCRVTLQVRLRGCFRCINPRFASMQAALTFTVADKPAAGIEPLKRRRARLGALSKAFPIQRAGPVGSGRRFGPCFAKLRADLARRRALREPLPWRFDRTVVLDVAQGLALLSGTMGKIGQDAALMAQTEVAAIRLAGGGASSAMAHKRNRVGAEVPVALGRLVARVRGTLAQSMIHGTERSGAARTLEWLVLPQMAQAAGRALCSRRTF